jgi:hypothetical protein
MRTALDLPGNLLNVYSLDKHFRSLNQVIKVDLY